MPNNYKLKIFEPYFNNSSSTEASVKQLPSAEKREHKRQLSKALIMIRKLAFAGGAISLLTIIGPFVVMLVQSIYLYAKMNITGTDSRSVKGAISHDVMVKLLLGGVIGLFCAVALVFLIEKCISYRNEIEKKDKEIVTTFKNSLIATINVKHNNIIAKVKEFTRTKCKADTFKQIPFFRQKNIIHNVLINKIKEINQHHSP